MIRVGIIDDHPMIYEGLKGLLSSQGDISLESYAPNAFDGMQMLKKKELDVVLLDINLPDINGIDLCCRIKKDFPNIKILALSTFKERSYMTKMMASGASGYLQKSVTTHELVEGIKEVLKGNHYFDHESGKLYDSIIEETERLPLITTRELQVLKMIAEGFTNAQIADKIFVSPLTVDSHRKNLIAKLKVKKHGFIDPVCFRA